MLNNLTRLILIAGWKPDFRTLLTPKVPVGKRGGWTAQKYLRLFKVEAQKYLRPLRRDPEVPAVVSFPTPRSTCGVGRMLVAWSSHCHRSTCWQSGLGAGKREERLSAALSELPSPAGAFAFIPGGRRVRVRAVVGGAADRVGLRVSSATRARGHPRYQAAGRAVWIVTEAFRHKWTSLYSKYSWWYTLVKHTKKIKVRQTLRSEQCLSWEWQGREGSRGSAALSARCIQSSQEVAPLSQ